MDEMKRVYKYPVPYPDGDTGRVVILMPKDAQVVSAGVQSGHIMLWAVVSKVWITEPREFLVINTGRGFIGSQWKYLSSVNVSGIVWHIFQ